MLYKLCDAIFVLYFVYCFTVVHRNFKQQIVRKKGKPNQLSIAVQSDTSRRNKFWNEKKV